MRTAAQPAVSYCARVSVETDQLRRRLQEELDVTGSELIALALRTLDDQVQAEQNTPTTA
jgi:hypothetical protein